MATPAMSAATANTATRPDRDIGRGREQDQGNKHRSNLLDVIFHKMSRSESMLVL
jgi:hypothetical protein